MSELLKTKIQNQTLKSLLNEALEETQDLHWNHSVSAQKCDGKTIYVETNIEWIGHRVNGWVQHWEII